MPHFRENLTRRKFIDCTALSVQGLCAYPVVKGAAAGDAGVTLSMKNHYGSCDKPGNIHGG